MENVADSVQIYPGPKKNRNEWQRIMKCYSERIRENLERDERACLNTGRVDVRSLTDSYSVTCGTFSTCKGGGVAGRGGGVGSTYSTEQTLT